MGTNVNFRNRIRTIKKKTKSKKKKGIFNAKENQIRLK